MRLARREGPTLACSKQRLDLRRQLRIKKTKLRSRTRPASTQNTMISTVRNVTSSPAQLFGIAVVVMATLIGLQFLAAQNDSGLFEAPAVSGEPVHQVEAPVVAVEPVSPDDTLVFGAPAEPPVEVSEPVPQPVEVIEEVIEPVFPATPEPRTTLIPTFSWFNVYGDDVRVGNRPVQPGDVITAYDSDGNLSGRFAVTDEGRFGLMAVYYDDPATEVDEGMGEGDAITFKINGQPANVPSLEQPKWNANTTLLYVNLEAEG